MLDYLNLFIKCETAYILALGIIFLIFVNLEYIAERFNPRRHEGDSDD